jgi:two-component system OmpR family response regulator
MTRPDRRSTPPAHGAVLVVDDDEHLVALLQTALGRAGCTTLVASSGREALAVIERQRPDLVLLDVGLPDLDGFALLARVRATGDRTPVIFVTGRGATEERVRGLTSGADDYVVKPFAVAELVARVDLVLRRHGLGSPDRRLRCADLVLDEDAHRVTRAGAVVSLSPTEHALLRYLLVNCGRVLTRNQILEHVWGYDFDGQPTVVDTFISYLRRKVDTAPPTLIHTVRGVGFCLRVEQG